MSSRKVSAAILLLVPLLMLGSSSLPMLSHSDQLGHCPESNYTFKPLIREAALGRVTVCILGGLLIYLCVKKGSTASWTGLIILFGGYFLPLFVAAFLRAPRASLATFPSSRLAQHNLLAALGLLFAIAGLFLSFPRRMGDRRADKP